MKALEIFLLVLTPTAWARWNDRNGDEHKNLNDIFWESVIMLGCGGIVFWIENYNWLVYLKALLVSITGFGFLFTYSFNWYWFSKYFYGSFEGRLYYTLTHLSKTAIPDRWNWWKACGWFGRLLIYLVLFGLSVYWFTIG